MSDDLPKDFDIPEALRAQAIEIRKQYNMTAIGMVLAEKLTEIGVEMYLAIHIAVADLRVAAALLAVIACEMEKREPRKDLWMQRAEEDLDQAREWLARMQAESDDTETCVACGEPIEDGELVYSEHGEGGHIHATCCGPEREGFCGPDGEPLGPDDPIPEPFAYRAEPDEAST